MERMLINATDVEELRVALVKDNYLYDLDIERSGYVKKKANIYKGRITRVEPSLEAAFVDYGEQRQGFLPFKEIAPEYYQKDFSNEDERPNIKDAVKEGQELIIQIEKEERGTKGAALTTYLTLAGCYLILMPNNPRSGGISRRIEGEDRDSLRDILKNLTMPENMGVIVRTAGVGKSQEDLQWDLDALINLFHAITKAADAQRAPFLIHQEGDVIIRSIRDNLRKEIGEIIVDSPECFIRAKNYIEQVKPDFLKHIKLYQDTVPLFNRYLIESQIETAYQREVPLPSGGSIVIDRTEALVSIDINSAKATGGEDIEATALNTNLEAAVEIARQLRLRDLGGLIVIDFIDMGPTRNQREVEDRLREALRSDRARIQIGRISRFGLLEMSRQRLRLSLGETTQSACKHCEGRGTIRSIQSLSFSIIRLLEDEALKQGVNCIQAQLPVSVATFIFNEKRHLVLEIEKRHNVNIVIVPNHYLDVPNYKIEGLKGEKSQVSYDLVDQPEIEISKSEEKSGREMKPAVSHYATKKRSSQEAEGVIKRLWNVIFGASDEEEKTQETKKSRHEQKRRPRHSSADNRGRSSDRRNSSHGSERSGGGRPRGRARSSHGRRQTASKHGSSRNTSNRGESEARSKQDA